ncbi:MAG: ankyrin repeat domain-containing protein [Candidatus Ozemobacteraceae bacterium]
MNDLEKLLQSPEENERLKGIALLVKQPSMEHFAKLRELADHDECQDVRGFARKALDTMRAALKPQVAEGIQQPVAIDIRQFQTYLEGTEAQKLALIQYVSDKHLVKTAPALLNHIKRETSPTVVSAILKALGKLAGEGAVRVLVPFLTHVDSRIRANAIEALELTGSLKGYPFVIVRLNDPDPRVRANAAGVLRKIPHLETVNVLKAMAKSPQPGMQASAAYVLQLFPGDENALLLETLLGSADATVRKNAGLSLRKMAEKGCQKAKEILTKSSVPVQPGPETAEMLNVQVKAIEEVKARLQTALQNPDPGIRIQAVQWATQQGGLGIVPILIAHFDREKNEKVVASILISLGRLKAAKALPHLVSALKHPDARCRANAVEAIRLIGDSSVFDHLKLLLGDSNNRVRANAILALRGYKDVDVEPPLVKMVNSSDENTQKSAMYAVGELKERRFYSLLEILSKSSFPGISGKARSLLKTLGEEGKLTVPSPGVPAPTIECNLCHGPMAQGPENWVCLNEKCRNTLSFGEVDQLSGIMPLQKIPTVLAIPFQEYFFQGHEVQKLWDGCETIEMLLHFLVIVGIADIREKGELPDDLVAELRKFDRINGGVMGKWRGMAEAVAKAMKPGEAVVPEIREFVIHDLIPFYDGTTKSDSFEKLRKSLAHGGGITRKAAQKLLDIWKPRFDAVLSKLPWLNDLEMIMKEAGQLFILSGPALQPFKYNIAVGAQQVASGVFEKIFSNPEAVAMVRGEKTLQLWPLTLFGKPRPIIDPDMAISSRNPQVYSRLDKKQLEFCPVGSDEIAVSVSDFEKKGYNEFLRIFHLDRPVSRTFAITDFLSEICHDADLLIGRDKELSEIRTLFANVRAKCHDSESKKVIWLTGNAGIGKSYLVAKFTMELLEATEKDLVVLPYCFKAGDDFRCSRETFLKFAVERLKAWIFPPSSAGCSGEPVKEPAKEKPPEIELKELLATLEKREVIFILDGLDEIAIKDPKFAPEIPLHLSFPGVMWFCSGRPERGLPEQFAPSVCHVLFPNGVPAMGIEDIRAMLLERMEQNRFKLLQNDEEIRPFSGSAQVLDPVIKNAFAEKVAQFAAGLPLYVYYVIEDILANRINRFDGTAPLPESLQKYHEELINRLSVGSLQQILTPLACHLAIAMEPLNADELAEILVQRNLIDLKDEPNVLVQKGLTALHSMIKLGEKTDKTLGFTLYHHSLREHMLKSPPVETPIQLARKAICDLVMREDMWSSKAGIYLLRWGVRHLIDEKRWEEIENLLLNLFFLEAKTEAGMVFELTEDFARLGLQPKMAPPIRTPWKYNSTYGVWCPFCLAWSEISPDSMGKPETGDTQILTEGGRPQGDFPGLFSCPGCNHLLQLTSFFIEAEWKPCGPQRKIEPDPELPAMPPGLPHRWMLALIEEALGRELHAISRHPTTLFQCLWNLCWWYDSPEALFHNHKGTESEKTLQPVAEISAMYKLFEIWRAEKERKTPGFFWVKSLRPLQFPLGSGLVSWISSAEASGGLAFSPCGTFFAWEDACGRIALVNSATGKLHCHFEGPRESIGGISFSPCGGRVLAWFSDKSIRIWEIASGNECLSLFGHQGEEISQATFSYDGRRILSNCSGGRVVLWDAFSGEKLWQREFSGGNWGVVCFSNDNSRIFSTVGGGKIQVLRTDNGELIQVFPDVPPGRRTLLISPDGTFGISDFHQRLFFWDPQSGKTIGDPISVGESLTDSAVSILSPDGRLLLSLASDKTVKIWDVPQRRQIRRISGFGSSGVHMAFHPNGDEFAFSLLTNDVVLWRARVGKDLPPPEGHSENISMLGFSQDGEHLFSVPSGWRTPEKRVLLWNGQTGKLAGEISANEEDPRAVTFIECANLVAVAFDNDIRFFEISTQREVESLKVEQGNVTAMESSPDGGILLVAVGRIIRFWSIPEKRWINEIPCRGFVFAMALSSDNKLLLSGEAACHREVKPLEFFVSPQGATNVLDLCFSYLRVFDSVYGEELFQTMIPRDFVLKAGFSEREKRFSASTCRETLVWDLPTHRLLGKFPGRTDVTSFLGEGKTGLFPREGLGEVALCLLHSGQPVTWVPLAASSNRGGGFCMNPKGGTLAIARGRTLHIYRIEGDLRAFSEKGEGHPSVHQELCLLSVKENQAPGIEPGLGDVSAIFGAVDKFGMNFLMRFVVDGNDPGVDWWLKNHGPLNCQDFLGNTALHHAIAQRQEALFQKLLLAGGDPQIRNSFDRNALSEASFHGWLEAVKILLAREINFMVGENLESPVDIAGKNGHFWVVKELLEKGYRGKKTFDREMDRVASLVKAGEDAKIPFEENILVKQQLLDLKSDAGWLTGISLLSELLSKKQEITPETISHCFSKSVQDEAPQIFPILLELGGNPNTRDPSGRSALKVAAGLGVTTAVDSLIRAGADPNESQDGCLPLTIAAQQGQFAAIRLLLAKGADPNKQDEGGGTPLIYSAQKGFKNICHLLLDNGASINLSDFNGLTPLRNSLMGGNLPMARFLLAKGADPKIPDRKGGDALIDAIRAGKADQVKLLLEFGCDPKGVLPSGVTLLCQVAQMGLDSILNFMIKSGGNVNGAGYKGRTPMMMAAGNGRLQCVSLLLGEHADKEIRDDSGFTAFDWAIQTRQWEAAKLLFSPQTGPVSSLPRPSPKPKPNAKPQKAPASPLPAEEKKSLWESFFSWGKKEEKKGGETNPQITEGNHESSIRCSFCHFEKKEVAALHSGKNGSICETCIDWLMHNIFSVASGIAISRGKELEKNNSCSFCGGPGKEGQFVIRWERVNLCDMCLSRFFGIECEKKGKLLKKSGSHSESNSPLGKSESGKKSPKTKIFRFEPKIFPISKEGESQINGSKGKGIQCTFCKKSQEVIKKIISGPDVNICNECIVACLPLIYGASQGMDSTNKEETLACHFCGKSLVVLEKLVVGPECSICGECLDLCREILSEG